MKTSPLERDVRILLQAFRKGIVLTAEEVLSILTFLNHHDSDATENEIADLHAILVGSPLNVDKPNELDEGSYNTLLKESGDLHRRQKCRCGRQRIVIGDE